MNIPRIWLEPESGINIMTLAWLQLQDNNGSSSEEEAEEEDIDVALKKEVAQLQASGAKQERRFQALDSGANNVIFIKTNNLGEHLIDIRVGVIVCLCFV